jgi:hypothetical protein
MTQTGIDIQMILIIFMSAVSIISLVISIFAIARYKNIYRLYDSFMRGRDAESLEDIILEEQDRIEALEEADASNKEVMRTMNRNIRASFQKCGVVRYDAFEGMGGKVSFAMALLDYTNTGVIINCMHSATGCFLYVKEVDAGTTEVQLGAEEKGALERALGYVHD